jgi:hypothetical protein
MSRPCRRPRLLVRPLPATTWQASATRDSLLIDPSLNRLVLIQPECPGDAVVFDRVLIVHLAVPLDVAGFDAVLQDGIDTTQ